jgi:RsiW-degrading membrane proteinase PrsW (M82 family)
MATTIGTQPELVRPAPTAPAWRRYMRDILWAARITVALAILLASRTWPAWWHEITCLIILALLTYPVRSVRWGTIYNFFLLGIVFAYVIVGCQYVIERVLWEGQHEMAGGLLVAPLTEEIGKVLPLALILVFGWRGFRISYGACDIMLCGAGLGCGFGLVEDVGHRMQSWPTASGPALFGVSIFPDAYSGFLGHGASAAFIALTLGYWTYACRRKRWFLPSLIAVLVALFWMMVDHSLSNYAVGISSINWFAPIRWVWTLDAHGELSPSVLLLLILGTVVAERILLSRSLRRFPRLKPGACFAYLQRPLRQGWGYPQLRSVVVRLQSLLLYLLSYRRLGFLLAHWPGDVSPNRENFAGLIGRYTGKVALVQRAVRKP